MYRIVGEEVQSIENNEVTKFRRVVEKKKYVQQSVTQIGAVRWCYNIVQ